VRSRTRGLVDRLGDRAELEGIGTLSEEERTVLLPWWARGVIGNGGFRYFYEGSADLHEVARRMAALGFADVARALEAVATRVDASVPGRAAQTEHLDRIRWKDFEVAEGVVLELDFDALLAAIERYVEDRPAAFSR
jgi:hypothetical protein